MAGFKIPIVADTSGFISESGKVEDALEQIADALDTVGDDSTALERKMDQALSGVETSAKQAGKALGDDVKRGTKDAGRAVDDLGDDAKAMERKFSDSWREVAKDAKKTGKAIGDDVKDGTDKAAEGMGEFKDEAKQSAREGAASFSGEFDDVADYVQEVMANALSGFGPLGAAAGIAAAAGLGILVSSLQAGAEQAEETKQTVIDLATELSEVDGNPAALDWANHLRDVMNEIVDPKDWWEVWQDTPKTRLEEWSKAADDLGLHLEDALTGLAGDEQAWTRFMDQLADKTDEASRATQDMIDQGIDPMVANMTSGTHEIEKFKDELEAQKGVVSDSANYYDLMNQALSGVSDAQKIAADATAEYESAVAASLEKAGESWESYTTDGVVNLDAYNSAIEAQQAAIQSFEENLAAASGQLSADALAYIESLGPDAAPLLQAFADAPLDQQQRTAANWDAVGKASTKGYESSLKIDQSTSSAITKAQSTATAHPVMVKTKLAETLDYDIQRVISNVGTPTITVRLQASKTVY